MPKLSLNVLVRPKIFWPVIAILLILCVTFYTQKEKEKSIRIAKETELLRTIEAKKVVQNNLAEAKKEIAAKDEQIKLTLDKLEKETTFRKEVEAQLFVVSRDKQSLEEKVEKLAVSPPVDIELEKIVIKSSRELAGKVLAIDKEHGLVVTDLGSEHNLKLGDILSIYRNDAFMGRVRIEKIDETSSGATVLFPWKNVEFKENDVVKKL